MTNSPRSPSKPGREDGRRGERRERERADVEEHVVDRRAPGAPLDRAIVSASASAARGPKSAAPASEPTALTEIEPSSTSSASACPDADERDDGEQADQSVLVPKIAPNTPAADADER